MKSYKILNWFSLVVFLTVWIWLFIGRDSFRGSGLYSIKTNQGIEYFNRKSPYIFQERDSIIGLVTDKKSGKMTGVWILPSDSLNKISYLSFPAGKTVDRIVAAAKNEKQQWVFAGLCSDSLLRIFRYDTALFFYPDAVIQHPSLIKGFSVVKGAPELVLGKMNNQLGTILRFTDTLLQSRKYELPSFFDRICLIELAYHNNKQWQFLLSSDFYQRDTVWIRYDTNRFANTLMFDEKAIYPSYPGRPEVARRLLSQTLNRLPFGLLIKNIPAKICFNLEKGMLKKSSFPFDVTPDQSYSFAYQYDSLSRTLHTDISLLGPKNSKESAWSFFEKGQKGWTLLRYYDENRFSSSDGSVPEISLDSDDSIAAICRMGKDSFLVFTHSFKMAMVDSTGVLKSQSNFFTMLHTRVVEKNPGFFLLMDVKMLPVRALQWYAILGGPFFWWLLSLLFVWLFGLFSKKPTYYSRRKKKVYPAKNIFWGTMFYLLINMIYLAGFLVALDLV